jgi:NAD(P)-dependent dehydrogenase (short-subunit alcohol dehydrogenase family)
MSAAKMGLIGLARSLASNRRQNSAPTWFPRQHRQADNPEWYHGRVPNAAEPSAGRTCRRIAATCLFWCDDSGFITGQTIHVNGGVGFY